MATMSRFVLKGCKLQTFEAINRPNTRFPLQNPKYYLEDLRGGVSSPENGRFQAIRDVLRSPVTALTFSSRYLLRSAFDLFNSRLFIAYLAVHIRSSNMLWYTYSHYIWWDRQTFQWTHKSNRSEWARASAVLRLEFVRNDP